MAAVCETFLLQTRRLVCTWGRELTQRFRPTSVQFKGRINGDKARTRHQTRHLEVYTPQLLTEGLQVRVLPGGLPMKNELARASGPPPQAGSCGAALLRPP